MDIKRVLSLIAISLILPVQRAIHAADVTVFATASLTEALKEISANHEKQGCDNLEA